jgi:hypothetical protein
MATVMTALILLGIMGAIIGLILFVHKRDAKREAKNREQA